MKSSHWIKGTLAVVLALGILIGVHQQAAAAGSGACAAYTPAAPATGTYPAGFGSTLETPVIRGVAIAVCNNGYNGYYSGSSVGYGIAFQCVELTNRYAAQVFGSSVSAWGGDAKYHWTQRPGGWSQQPNNSNYRPVAGDIIVWGPVDGGGNPSPNANGNPGHVAIIYSVTLVNATTWSVVAVNENFSVSSSSPPISRTTGTIYRTSGDGLFWYDLVMNQGAAGSALYGVLHHA